MADFEQGKELLRVEHLCQYFGRTKAVDDVSFSIYKGEVFGLVGESGCGKTTTGRSIIKIYDITSGDIYLNGKRVAAGVMSYKLAIKEAKKRLKEAATDEERAALKDEIAHNKAEIVKAKKVQQKEKVVDRIQKIFQDPIASLDPRMTVKEIISEGLIIQGVKDKKEIEERVYEALEKVGLVREHAGRYPHEFSGGQRQRIGIARSVIMHPEMIIADEPVSALDVSIQAQVINLLNDLRKEYGITIMFIAHDLSVVKYFSDRIGVMYYGKMVELASSDELFAHPMHPYTRSLLSAIPLPDPDSEKKRKRLVYNKLKDHDYSVQGPTMREIVPGHFVYCNDEEEARYKKEFNL